MRRRLRRLSVVLILAGALLLADALATLTWQEPLSALWAASRQDALAGELAALERRLPAPLLLEAIGHMRGLGARVAYLARRLQAASAPGQPVGRLRIPRIGVDFVVVAGTTAGALRSGPGILEQTAFPGAPGTTAIAGHRTTFLAPFRRLDRLRPGDAITLEMPYARIAYSVQSSEVVSPQAVSVLRPAGYDRLVLSACDPLFSAARRLVVFARLRSLVALGAARARA